MRQSPLALLALALTPSLTVAGWTGPYVHGDLGMSFVSIDQSDREDALQDSSTSEDSDSFAYSFGFGYRFHRHFSLEASGYDLGEFEASISGEAEGGSDFNLDQDISISGYGLRGIGHYPVSERWALDGSLGLARMTLRNEGEGNVDDANFTSTESSSDVVVTVGLGATLQLRDQFSVRGQYMYFDDVGDSDTGESEVQYVSVGAIYNF